MNGKISRYFHGTMEKKEFSRIFISVLVYFVLSCIIAQILFRNIDVTPPDTYSILRYRISQQGYLHRNPIGGWFFIISAGITGIMLIGYFMYIYQRLKNRTILLSKLMLISSIIGSIGFTIVGIFPMGEGLQDQIHGVGSDLAFYGLGIGTFLSLFIMIRRISLKERWPSLPQFIIIYGIVIIIGSLIAVFDIGEFQQWLGFFTIFSWVIGLFIISPKTDVNDIKL